MESILHIFDWETPKKGFVQLVDSMNQDVALKVVNSARVSYGNIKTSFDKSDQKLTKFLWDHEHTSPFRHSYYTFAIKAPLFVFRQWTKYQVGSTWRSYSIDEQDVLFEVYDTLYDTDKGCSWNELSGRYKELEPEFYIPNKVRSNPPHGNKQSSAEILKSDEWHDSQLLKMLDDCENAYKLYQSRIENGWAKEMARMMLPQNIYSMSYWTVSLQSILWFLHQRTKDDAQFEIRKYAEGIQSLIQPDLDKLGLSL